MRKKIINLLCVILGMLYLITPAMTNAAETDARMDNDIIYIEDALGLFHIYDNPYGHYVLVNDIDMTDLIWLPIPFYGILDGNGHTIENLSISLLGADSRITFDGNYKKYDTVFAGLFSVVENASIKNLAIHGMDACIETDANCFIGGIAGYVTNTNIDNCNIEGTIDLTTSSHMFGIAGIAGFGYGSIRDCETNVILICTDTNVKDKDEQFLGGIFGDGLFTMERNHVCMKGYISDHGYVHSGGMGGMIISYQKNILSSDVTIRDNVVEGKITFFEDNKDRRAYCKDIIGEYMYKKAKIGNNYTEFVRDERFDYSVNLRPE